MFLVERKIDRRIAEIKEYRYRDRETIEYFLTKEDDGKEVNPKVPTVFDEKERILLGERWSGRDRYLWLHRKLKIKEEWKGKQIVALFDFGKTGSGHNSGFESLLFLNGEMYQGVDSNHKEVFLSDSHCGTQVDVTLRLWSGLEGGGIPQIQEHKIQQAEIGWLDEEVDDFYYTASTIYQTVEQLGENDPIRVDLLQSLDKAIKEIDWSDTESEDFYQSIYRANKQLNDDIDRMQKTTDVQVICIGHTHIDMAWLWRLKHTKEKAGRSFSTVIRLMERYPEYIFLQTQPQLYEYVKDNFPELYNRIKEKVKEGRWETDGAMWVEADCNLTSGESLTRQILLGSKFFQEEFGKETEYLWLPDVFGYSWALPQILKKSGITMFMTTKISWNQYNRMPHDTFWWRGIDGSEILTHFITTPSKTTSNDNVYYTYNGEINPFAVQGIWNTYRDKNVNKELLLSYGYGDGGGGVNRDMLEYRRRIDKIPALPHCKTGTAKEYFRRLKETVQNTEEYVHTWDGELYLEYHRGTYTSQAYNKKMNRKMEYLYRYAEWLTTLKGIVEHNLEKANQETLTKGWKELLTHQFHDIIPGSSIREVYEDSKVNYEYIEKIGNDIKKDALESFIIDDETCYTIINDGVKTEKGIVEFSDIEESFVDEDGKILPCQREKNKMYVLVDQIKGNGFTKLYKTNEKSEVEKSPFVWENHTLETPFYHIVFNEYGQIETLFDKEMEREVIEHGKCGNVFQVFEDKPIHYDAWDIDLFYQQKMKEVTNCTKIELVEQGALYLKLRFQWTFSHSTINQELIVYAHSKRIDFDTTVDYHEQYQLLKVAFPVAIRSTSATYDIQYGNVKRPTHWNTSWDQARFESVAHRFVDLSEYDYGVALLNDCKYGHDIKDNTIRLSLIKTAKYPDYMQDQGIHQFRYALFPHKDDFVKAGIVEEAHRFNQPYVVVKGKIKAPFEQCLSFENGKVEFDAMKKSEDGTKVVVRFHEYAGSSSTVKIKTGFDWKQWQEGDLRERPIEEPRTDEIVVPIKPYEIKTILIQLK